MKKLALTAIVVNILLAACGGGGKTMEQSDPEQSFAYHYNLGLAAFERGEYEEASQHFVRSIQLNGRIARTHSELGTCYIMLGRYQDAITAFEDTLALEPSMIEAHNSLGIAYMRTGNYREAERHFRLVLDSHEYGTKFIPLYNLGNLYYEEKNYDQALHYFRDALLEESKVTLDYRIVIHQQLGNTYYELGDYEQALKEFEQVLVLSPRTLDAAYKAGVSALRSGDTDRARQYFSKTITIDPGSEQAKRAREYLDQING